MLGYCAVLIWLFTVVVVAHDVDNDERPCACVCETSLRGILRTVESCVNNACRAGLCVSTEVTVGVTCCDAGDSSFSYETEDGEDIRESGHPSKEDLDVESMEPHAHETEGDEDSEVSVSASVFPSMSVSPSMSGSPTASVTPSSSRSATPSPSVSVTPTPSQAIGRIVYAADNTAELFVNGISIHGSFDWRTTARVDIPLEIGDVVGIHAKDNGGGWHGVIVAIELNGEIYATGRSDEWKAVKEFVISGDELLWTYKSFVGCEWPRATVLPLAEMERRGKAEDFEYQRTGARYVWAENAGGNEGVFLRIVIGGERCFL